MSSQINQVPIKEENVISEKLIQNNASSSSSFVDNKKTSSSSRKDKPKTTRSKKTVRAKPFEGFAPTNDSIKQITSAGLVYLDDEQSPTDPFVALFFFILEDLFGVTFKNTHFYSVNFMVTDFFQSLENEDLLHEVAYTPGMFAYYTRHRSDQVNKINTKIKKKSSLNCFKDERPNSYPEVDKLIRARLVPFQDTYWSILKNVSIQKRIEGFHTLEANYVWYYDFTQVEWFGDGNKKTGPYLLFFVDCASRKVVHWGLFSTEQSITSALIIQELDKALANAANVPIFLHSDSDGKNLSSEIVSALMERLIIPSVNKNFYGVTDNPHENQVIESFNRRFKERLKKHLDQCNISIGSLHNKPLSELEHYVQEVLDQYHDKPHRHLSMVSFDKINALDVSPNSADQSSQLFSLLKITWDECISQMDPSALPPGVDNIKHLDFSNVNDQIKFVDFADDFIFNKFAGNSEDLSQAQNESIITLNKMKDETYSISFYDRVYCCYGMLYTIAMSYANTDERLISKFMNSQFVSTTKGPGRANNKKEEWKKMMMAKQQFVEYSEYFDKFFLSILGNLTRRFFLREHAFLLQRHTEDIKLDNRAALNQQTIELKQHNKEMQEKTSIQIDSLNKQIDDLKLLYEDTKNHLESYRFSEQRRLEMREKRKKRIQKIPTTPVTYNIFVECLNLLVSNGKIAPSQKYANARDRISIFLLFFSGMRVAMLSNFSFLQLATIFSFDVDTLKPKPGMRSATGVSVPVSKKRKAEQQTFAVAKVIEREYLYGKHNLQNDFAFLCERVKEYSLKNNLNYSEVLEMSYYSSFHKVDKLLSREQLNKNINQIVRDGAQKASDDKISAKMLQTYTSHSFRYYMATSIIAHHDVRVAQQFLHHSSIATTAHYDRNFLSNDKIKIITSNAASDHLKNLNNKFSEEQIREYGFRVASNKPYTDAELNKLEGQVPQAELFSPEEAKDTAAKAQRHVDHKNKARSNKKKKSS